jgi:hypothetical protein
MTPGWSQAPDEWGNDDEPYVENEPLLDGFPDHTGSSSVFDRFDTVENYSSESGEDRHQVAGGAEETVETLLVTGSDPGHSVTATALLGGRIIQIELAPTVAKLSEAELAREIVAVCNLTTRQAEAAQHHLIASLMCSLGHDPVSTRGFLEHTVGLPSPQTVRNEKARMFTHYYSSDE